QGVTRALGQDCSLLDQLRKSRIRRNLRRISPQRELVEVVGTQPRNGADSAQSRGDRTRSATRWLDKNRPSPDFLFLASVEPRQAGCIRSEPFAVVYSSVRGLGGREVRGGLLLVGCRPRIASLRSRFAAQAQRSAALPRDGPEWLWTISTRARTWSTGVWGRMPCPRLKMWPGRPRAWSRILRAWLSISAIGASRTAGSGV